METTIRKVNPARLAWGTFDHTKSDYVNEGDIPASYSGDCIAMGQPVRKPFRMDGEMWVTIALSNKEARAYRLCPPRIFKGTTTTYRDKTGTAERAEEARNDPNGFYDRMIVKHGGQEFVLCGPEMQIVAGAHDDIPAPQVQLALF
jgi:hypothetical protein